MEFVDTHCHLNHAQYADDGEAVLERARAAGVTRLLCIGWDRAGSRRAVELTAQAGVYAAIGIHPESAGEWTDEGAADLRALFDGSRAKVKAFGEIGLDYHWDSVPREQQQAVFAAQIAFARDLSPLLPLVIHCRDAQDDVLTALREAATPAPIIMHCFTGDSEAARACLDAGCYLGIGGVATFKKSDALREAIASAPLDRLLLETDCPYLAPQFRRGKRNEPSYLPAIAQAVADAKQLPLETIAKATTETALALFGMG